MANTSFLFRVDASLLIGAGHVMRCLTLADRLCAGGADCSFVCREHVGHLCDLIEGHGYTVHRLPVGETLSAKTDADSSRGDYARWLGTSEEEDAALTAGLIASAAPPDWIVVDHYALGARWERALRSSCRKMFAIDDLADRAHDCDVLLDQNLGRSASDYDGLLPTHCQKFIGPAYALLRPEFARLRPASLARRMDGQCRNILVTMGGVDRDNMTGAVLEALDTADLPAYLRLIVVLGASAPWKDAVWARARDMHLEAEIVVGANNMAELMRDADLAIGAAGSTAWERCCMGLPAIAVVTARNQIDAASHLSRLGGGVIINNSPAVISTIGNRVNSLLNDQKRLKKMSLLASNAIDGRGTERLCASLEALK